MEDNSKIPMERVEELDDTISNIQSKFDDMKTLLDELKADYEEKIALANSQIQSLSTQLAETNAKFSNSNYVIPYPTCSTTGRITVAADTDYTLTTNAWVWWGNTSYVGSRTFLINGITFGRSYGNSGHWEEFNSMFVPLKKGTVIRHSGGNSIMYVYPM